MTDFERVLDWFKTGTLARPGAGEESFVDLVRALLRLAGAGGMAGGKGVETLMRRIGAAEHYVFVLIDGLGANQLERLFAPDSFARRHVAGRLGTVWPSTTATALTTLATGDWPAAHGVGGWWTYLADRDLSVVTLPFQQRGTNRPLGLLGVRADELFPLPSVWPRMRHAPRTLLPAKLVHSTYSTYSRGGTAAEGYGELAELPERIAGRVRSAGGPTLTYLYLPQLDTLSHKKGPDAPEVRLSIPALDCLLSDLAGALAGKARLVVTADHGQVAAPRSRWFFVPPTNGLAERLRCRPSGEPSVPFFHVVDGQADAFADAFRTRFGEHFALLTPDEVERLGLLGPPPLSEAIRGRLGTFVGIAPQPAKFLVLPADPGAGNLGVHGGLTHDEMFVPLILA